MLKPVYLKHNFKESFPYNIEENTARKTVSVYSRRIYDLLAKKLIFLFLLLHSVSPSSLYLQKRRSERIHFSSLLKIESFLLVVSRSIQSRCLML